MKNGEENMSGFDNWNKKTSDYLEEIFDKNHKNIDFDSLSKGKNPIKKTTYVGIKKNDIR